jgi:hypothetical protein
VGVPTSLTDAELVQMLSHQQVVEAYRFKHKSGAPTERVALSFSVPIPEEVNVAGISFRLGPYWPTPYKC